MNFRLWLEAKYAPDLVAEIKKKLVDDKYTSIWMDDRGNVKSGWPNRPDNMSFSKYRKSLDNKVGISADNKTIDFEMVGDKMKPATKKLVKFLMDNGIIDDTWKTKGGREISEYLGYDYTYFPDEHGPQKPSDVGRMGTFSAAIQDITLYHGTSDYDWKTIQQKGGLMPLFVGTGEYGFDSRAKHEYNKDLIYLATTRDKAWDYAKTRAQSMNRKYAPQEWKFSQYSGANSWAIKPVLLRVKVPDVSKLRSDDDAVNERMRKIAYRQWKKKSPEEQDRIAKELSKQLGYEIGDDPSTRAFAWRETDEGFAELLALVNPRMYRAWMASIMRYDQVAYKGIIPLSHVEEIPILPRKQPEPESQPELPSSPTRWADGPRTSWDMSNKEGQSSTS